MANFCLVSGSTDAHNVVVMLRALSLQSKKLFCFDMEQLSVDAQSVFLRVCLLAAPNQNNILAIAITLHKTGA